MRGITCPCANTHRERERHAFNAERNGAPPATTSVSGGAPFCFESLLSLNLTRRGESGLALTLNACVRRCDLRCGSRAA